MYVFCKFCLCEWKQYVHFACGVRMRVVYVCVHRRMWTYAYWHLCRSVHLLVKTLPITKHYQLPHRCKTLPITSTCTLVFVREHVHQCFYEYMYTRVFGNGEVEILESPPATLCFGAMPFYAMVCASRALDSREFFARRCLCNGQQWIRHVGTWRRNHTQYSRQINRFRRYLYIWIKWHILRQICRFRGYFHITIATHVHAEGTHSRTGLFAPRDMRREGILFGSPPFTVRACTRARVCTHTVRTHAMPRRRSHTHTPRTHIHASKHALKQHNPHTHISTGLYIHAKYTYTNVHVYICMYVIHAFSCMGMCMGWLRLVGSLKLQVSFAEYSLFYRALSQKRPTILRSLLIVATP